ncbi:MAG: 5-oxoprolinase subunit PxpB [Chitinophagaceae bacterium]
MNSENQYTVYAIGDSAITFDMGNIISEELNNKVMAMADWLRKNPFEGLKDLITAYGSVTVVYDAPAIHVKYKLQTTVFEFVRQNLYSAYQSSSVVEKTNDLVRIPVCYDLSFGYDLEFVANDKRLTIDDIIRLHTERTYRVYMIGFLPGFAYMAKTDERLTVSRKKVPRQVVDAGSVGLAGNQTGIYPLNSPGGWQIIGRTPVALFVKDNEKFSLLKPGNYVEFYPITLNEYERISQPEN